VDTPQGESRASRGKQHSLGSRLEISEFLTPAEAAAILKCSPETIIRRFERLPGVIDLGSPEGRFKRRYRVLRIPRNVFQRFLAENRVQ
jgi:hypothetical protein